MLNRTNRKLSAKNNGLNLGTRSLAVKASGNNSGTLTLLTAARLHAVRGDAWAVRDSIGGDMVDQRSYPPMPMMSRTALSIDSSSRLAASTFSRGSGGETSGQVASLATRIAIPAVPTRTEGRERCRPEREVRFSFTSIQDQQFSRSNQLASTRCQVPDATP